MRTNRNGPRRRRQPRRRSWAHRFRIREGKRLLGGLALIGVALAGSIIAMRADPVEGVVVDTWTEEHCSDHDPHFPPPHPPPPPQPPRVPAPYSIGADPADGVDLAADCETKLHAEVEHRTAEGTLRHGEFTYSDLDAVEVGDRVDAYRVWGMLFPSRFEILLSILALALAVAVAVTILVASMAGAVTMLRWGLDHLRWRRQYRPRRNRWRSSRRGRAP